jgi:hypothetical protein
MTLIDHNPKVASQEAGNKIRRYRIGFIAFFSLEVYILFETPLKNSVNEKLTIIASELRNALGISDQASQHLV